MDTALHSPRALGRALRDTRRGQGLNQGQAAELAGIAQPTVSRIERGEGDVSLSTLLRLMAALQLEFVLRDRAASDPGSPWENGS